MQWFVAPTTAEPAPIANSNSVDAGERETMRCGTFSKATDRLVRSTIVTGGLFEFVTGGEYDESLDNSSGLVVSVGLHPAHSIKTMLLAIIHVFSWLELQWGMSMIR